MPATLTHIPNGFSTDLATELANLIIAAYNQYKTPVGIASRWPLSNPHELIATFSARLPFHDTDQRRSASGRAAAIVGSVEEGFAAVYSQCTGTIHNALRGLTPRQVIVTGHSLGGALATLCTVDIKSALGVTPILYTFASPRVGDPTFAERFNAEFPTTWRVVNTEDLITNVPPSTSALDARHPTFLAWLLRLLARVPLISAWVRHRVGWTQLWRSNDLYEHVGTPVDFTKNNGTVLTNHQMSTYLAAMPT